MNTFAHKNHERASSGIAHRPAQRASDSRANLQPENESPAALIQRAMEENLNSNAKVQTQLQLQEMLDHSPHVTAQMKLAGMLSASRTQRAIQRQEGPEEEEELTQRQVSLEDEELIQSKALPLQRETMPDEEEPLQERSEPAQREENRTGLPDDLKAGVENLSGLSMDDVKVHYNSAEPATVQALAYTQGTEIHVAPGQERHLAHEAWHVAQQKQGRVRPTMQSKGVAINDDTGLEREADTMGARASALQPPVNESAEPSQKRSVQLLSRNQSHALRPTASSGGLSESAQLRQAGSIVIQRVITFKTFKEDDKDVTKVMTLEEAFENIKNTNDAKAFMKARGGEDALREWLIGIDGTTYDTRTQLLRQLKNAAKPNGGSESGPTKESFIAQERESFQGAADVVLGGAKAAGELYYKVALCRKLEDSSAYLKPFQDRMMRLAEAKKANRPVDWAGVIKTLNMLTASWNQPPDYYLKNSNQLTGGEKGGGIPLSFLGINSELDAILNISPQELAPDEIVFSGSTYTDAQVEAMNKDVDVSYIDSDGYLNLIESAKDVDTLYNKLSKKKEGSQQKIYQYLAFSSSEIVHEPVGGLTPEQAQRNSIRGVKWWYNVPPETLNLSVKDKKLTSCLQMLSHLGAGLRSGDTRLTPEQIGELI